METFTYDELRMMRDALNEWYPVKLNVPTNNTALVTDDEINAETFNPLMDKLDRMIQSKELVEKTLLPWEPR